MTLSMNIIPLEVILSLVRFHLPVNVAAMRAPEVGSPVVPLTSGTRSFRSWYIFF